MSQTYLFSSESVGEGHPDKVADAISDAVLDACLAQDPRSRVACETLVKSNMVVLAGEISTQACVNYEAIAREAIRQIGYIHDDDLFHADKVFVSNLITLQSPDIAQGVDSTGAEGKATAQQGAGDQGIMFGYACDQTPELMPAPIMYAHRLLREMAQLRKAGAASWLRPDVKSQVAMRIEDGRPTVIENVVLSTQHTADIDHASIRKFCIDAVIRKVLPPEVLSPDCEFLINPTGKFVLGGPQGDSGLTGRKVIVDTYGGWARHGGGAFSGKDASKVDRSAAYMSRWAAKHVVAAGLARACELQLAYAIGHPYPTSIHVDTFGTARKGLDEARITEALKSVFNFEPAAIVEQLDLLRPIFSQSTQYGHFAKECLPWEQLTKIDDLKAAL
jgi:S-adenosylmethionine synthetase